jgi:DNA transposition AAA+ family ATPase
MNAALDRTRTLFYTPEITDTPRQLGSAIGTLATRLNICVHDHLTRDQPPPQWRPHHATPYLELLIVDEADWLRPNVLEHLRGLYDRSRMGLILIGMPGIDKRLARYPQLYSRIGFAHHYRPLSGDELAFVLTRHWRKLGLELDTADFTDTQAIAAVARITGGNFRLIHRLFVQIERILKINDLTVITSDVVEAARDTLVIGTT